MREVDEWFYYEEEYFADLPNKEILYDLNTTFKSKQRRKDVIKEQNQKDSKTSIVSLCELRTFSLVENLDDVKHLCYKSLTGID